MFPENTKRHASIAFNAAAATVSARAPAGILLAARLSRPVDGLALFGQQLCPSPALHSSSGAWKLLPAATHMNRLA